MSGTVTAVPTGTQTVDGTVTAVPSGTQTITGSGSAGTAAAGVISVQGINNAFPLNVSVISQTGIVCKHTKNTSVASASTSTMSYTVTAGKTLYLKGVIATSSGAPCKVTIDDGTNTYATGFYSAAMPYLAMDFVQPPSFAAGTVINVKVENNADAAQDVYSTIMGEER